MDFGQILVMMAAALLYGLVLPARWRGWALMLASVVAIYWLQPTLAVRWLDYALPTAALALTVACWWFTRPQLTPTLAREDWLALASVLAIALILTLARYVDIPAALQLTSRPPESLSVVLALGLFAGITLTIWRLIPARGISLLLIVVIGMLVVLQTPPLATAVAGLLRLQATQDVGLASARDLSWLGFSYVAFRLIHTLRDRQTGILPPLSLRDYITFVIFAPAYTAGPIDRAERFLVDLQALPLLNGRDTQRITLACSRIAVGMVKKFVIADQLALFSLDALNATQAVGAGAYWLMLYGYGLRLFFDFSGYSDIAIGIGMLFGIQLPENFDRPYLRHNITAFWQAWHMSLTNWVRFYIFSPLSRQLLRRKPKPTNLQIMLVCHVSTMVIIGIWHGVTLPFFVWGLWHGLGLWVHKVWSDRTRKWYMTLRDKPNQRRAWTFAGWFLTFHFVMLGWVWFAMPDMGLALRVFGGLFGVLR